MRCIHSSVNVYDALYNKCVTIINSNLFDAMMQIDTSVFTLFNAMVNVSYCAPHTINNVGHAKHCCVQHNAT
jgi:hypothetical protein